MGSSGRRQALMRLICRRMLQMCAVLGLLAAAGTGGQAEIPPSAEPLGSQVTAASDCGYFAPVLSGDGQWIAVATDCPESDSPPIRHVVRIHRASRRAEAVTPPGVFSASPSISADGQRLVFLGDGDLIPGQNPNHVLQVFLYDARDRRYTQLTHFQNATENQFILKPQLSGNGDSVVLTSDADFVPGQNEDGNEEVFVFDLRSDRVSQITHSSTCLNLLPTLSADGRWLVFASNCEFDALNDDGEGNLFAMRLDTGEVIQLTHTGPGLVGFELLSVDLAGRTVAFAVGGNLPGKVMRSPQVFTTKLPARKDEPIAPPRFVEAEDISGLVVSAHDPAVMYLTTKRWGILKSTDVGRSWKLSSYRMGSEMVTCLVEDRAQRGVLYAGTANAGLYRTADGGEYWFPVKGLSSRRILSLAIDPVIPGRMSVRTPDGLFWSADRGSRWEPASDQQVANSDPPQAIITSQADRLSDPSHPSVLVARSATRGLMLSRDGGEHSDSLRIQAPSKKGLEAVLKRAE